MGSVPRIKVYDAQGKYQAACKEPEAALVLAEWYGDGATIRTEHAKYWTVWHQGAEESTARESIDTCVEIMIQNRDAVRRAFREKHGLSEISPENKS